MHRTRAIVTVGTGAALAAAALLAAGQDRVATPAPDPAATLRAALGPFVAAHCVECHKPPRPKHDLRFDRADDPAFWADRAQWRAVREQLVARTMPPKGFGKPGGAAYDAAVAALDAYLAAAPPANGPADPGRVTMRRLNRVEYERTVRDLLGVAFDARAVFPADDVGSGFDNQGDVLALPPILLEKYLDAAERIAAQAIVDPDPERPPVRRLDAGRLQREGPGGARRGAQTLVSEGEIHAAHDFPRDGEYVLRVIAWGDQAGPDPVRMAFRLDKANVELVEVPATDAAPGTYETRLRVAGGAHRVGVAFTNDYYRPEDPDPRQRDRNMHVRWLEIEGPVDPQTLPEAQRRLLPEPVRRASAARGLRVLCAELLPRAFRRPVPVAELDRFAWRIEEAAGPGATLEHRARLALVAALVSPHFLFRIEADAKPADLTPHPCTPHELAARLSYFLWSSMPDDALRTRADDGSLAGPETLAAEATRMLRDARASALAEHFATQWLRIRALAEAAPDPRAFPDFDPELREAMQAETELFVEAIFREDRPLTELLDADFTFLNARLARHYGLPGVAGDRMRRVALPDGRRGGVLTHASVLTATSTPTRTSPVKRGKWILEALLDAAPPPPPPGLDAFDESPAAARAASVRTRLEIHRQKPDCAVCHARMDALGFCLEPYDAIGRWRTRDGTFPVDATGTLPDGRTVEGPGGLKALLRDDPAFLRALTRHLLTYALGRGLGPADDAAVARCVAEVRADPRLSRLVRAIVMLEAFRMRRGEAPPRRTEGF